jgi:predicted ATPase
LEELCNDYQKHKVTLLTGDNVTGKSLIRTQLAFLEHTENPDELFDIT